MTMKKRWLLIGATTMIAFVIVCGFRVFMRKDEASEFAVPTEYNDSKAQKEATVTNPASANTTLQEKEPDGGGCYILKTYMDRIAVYRVFGEGTQVLAQIVDVNILSLPKEDIENLTRGIVVYSKEALIRLLEDFTS